MIRFSEARRFAETDVSCDDQRKTFSPKYFTSSTIWFRSGAAVEHRQEDTFDVEAFIPSALHHIDGVEAIEPFERSTRTGPG